MTINIAGDRSIQSSSGLDSVSLGQSSGTRSSLRSGAQEDSISMSSGTLSIQNGLLQVAAARAQRVASLAKLYSAGRYTPDSTGAAKSLVLSAGSVKIL